MTQEQFAKVYKEEVSKLKLTPTQYLLASSLVCNWFSERKDLDEAILKALSVTSDFLAHMVIEDLETKGGQA